MKPPAPWWRQTPKPKAVRTDEPPRPLGRTLMTHRHEGWAGGTIAMMRDHYRGIPRTTGD